MRQCLYCEATTTTIRGVPVCAACSYARMREANKSRTPKAVRQCAACGVDLGSLKNQGNRKRCFECAAVCFVEQRREADRRLYELNGPEKRARELKRIRVKRENPDYAAAEREAVKQRMRRLRKRRKAATAISTASAPRRASPGANRREQHDTNSTANASTRP